MPVRHCKKLTAQLKVMSKMDEFADLYAKRFDLNASGVVVHAYGSPRGYEVEVLSADGHSLTVNTVGETELLLTREPEANKQ